MPDKKDLVIASLVMVLEEEVHVISQLGMHST